jgi:hypothetical protein
MRGRLERTQMRAGRVAPMDNQARICLREAKPTAAEQVIEDDRATD